VLKLRYQHAVYKRNYRKHSRSVLMIHLRIVDNIRAIILIPWWLKIVVKIAASRIPLGYHFFASIGIFRHGHMQNPDYSIGVFLTHFRRSIFASKNTGFVGLEIGVGDSLASAIIAKAHGATKCYLVDSGRYAVEDINTYSGVAKELRSRGLDVEDVDDVSNIDELLSKFCGEYLTEGTRSLESIPDQSVDFVWSQAVLEHVRLDEFDDMLAELHRIVKPSGVLSHRVDLKDHLGGALNNRRFPTKIWEAEWMASSGFYTNRIKFSDMISRFERAGFAVEVVGKDEWVSLPTPRDKMAAEFQSGCDSELLVSAFDVLLRR